MISRRNEHDGDEAKKHLELCKASRLFIPNNDVLDIAIQALEEVEQSRAIGTIDEFKALKEKSAAKKVKKSGVTDSNGVFHAINGINGVPYDLCPNCEINLCTDGIFGGNTKGMKYCKNCGQKLDWE